MRIVVVGGGVIGLTSAYALAGDDHEVVVLERNRAPAEEASAASAGVMAPGHATSWASPAMLRRLPAILRGQDPKMRLQPHWDADLLRWGAAFLANCTGPRWERATLLRWALAKASLPLLRELVAETGVACKLQQRGALFLHPTEESLDAQDSALEVLRELGAPVRRLDPDECVRVEPALADTAVDLAGGIHDPEAMSGDCGDFTRGLAEAAGGVGVDVRTNVTVRGLSTARGRLRGVRVDDGTTVSGDAVVLAAGAHTARLLGSSWRTLGLYPVKGYGVMWDDVNGDDLPIVPGIDEGRLVAWARCGARLRGSGVAAFEGFREDVDDAQVAAVRAGVASRFPALRAAPAPRVAVGLRAVTADGVPRIGRVRYANLWVNTGHGNLGWTMSAASARLLTEHVAGRDVPQPFAALAP